MVQIKKNLFQIEEDYNVSLTNFFEGLFLSPFAEKVIELFREEYGIDIPVELVKRVKSLFTKSWQFLLERGFESEDELEAWKINNLKRLIERNGKKFVIELTDGVEEVEKIHKKYWDEFSDYRGNFIKSIESLLEKYGDSMAEEIERTTKVPWQAGKIRIFPVFDVKHRAMGNGLMLAFPKSKKIDKNIVTALVHEAVHTNTNPIWKKYREDESLVNANEIATHIVGLLVIERMNEKYGEKFSFKPRPKKIKGLLGKEVLKEAQKIWDSTDKMIELHERSKDFEDFLFKIQEFLDEIGYKPYYTGVKGEDYGKIFEKKLSSGDEG